MPVPASGVLTRVSRDSRHPRQPSRSSGDPQRGVQLPAVERYSGMSSASLSQASGHPGPESAPPAGLACYEAPLRLMAVHAHPDDESSKGAATMAKYVRDGAQVLVCTLTGGERGDILNPAMDRPEIKADIAAVRRAEMARAREIVGVEQRFLGFVD